jgi:rRNA maturation endonuclease Nob1
MVFCSNCGADIEEHQKFCQECGTKVEKTEHPSTSHPSPPEDPEIETRARNQSNSSSQKQGVLERLDIDKEDIDEVTEKAKKGLGRLGRIAKKGLQRGAELANQGIEVAKDTIEERRAESEESTVHAPVEGSKFCTNCGQSVSGPGKFCNHCGHKLE